MNGGNPTPPGASSPPKVLGDRPLAFVPPGSLLVGAASTGRNSRSPLVATISAGPWTRGLGGCFRAVHTHFGLDTGRRIAPDRLEPVSEGSWVGKGSARQRSAPSLKSGGPPVGVFSRQEPPRSGSSPGRSTRCRSSTWCYSAPFRRLHGLHSWRGWLPPPFDPPENARADARKIAGYGFAAMAVSPGSCGRWAVLPVDHIVPSSAGFAFSASVAKD